MVKRTHSPFSGLLATAFLVFLLGIACGAATGGDYVVLENTAAPNGTFALAWGYEKSGIDYEKLNKSDQEYQGKIPESNPLQNFVVNTITKTRIRTLEKAAFYKIGEFTESNSGMLHAWSEDSKLFVYGVSSKWETDLLDLYKLNSDGGFDRFELMEPLEKEIRAYLQKKHPKGYKEHGEGIVLSHSEISLSKTGLLHAKICVEVPKQEAFGFTLLISAQTDPDPKGVVKLSAVKIR